jgi:hypothetical protein
MASATFAAPFAAPGEACHFRARFVGFQRVAALFRYFRVGESAGCIKADLISLGIGDRGRSA